MDWYRRGIIAYIEYQIVCPFVGIRSHPLASVSPPLDSKGGETLNCGWTGEGPNSDEWTESMALCILCGGYPKSPNNAPVTYVHLSISGGQRRPIKVGYLCKYGKCFHIKIFHFITIPRDDIFFQSRILFVVCGESKIFYHLSYITPLFEYLF